MFIYMLDPSMAQIWLGVRVCKIAIVAARTTGVVLLSMGNVREQLATLLQKEPTDIVNIRKTDETPSRISVIDVISAITEQTGKNALTYLERLRHIHPEIDSVCNGFKFPGRGQQEPGSVYIYIRSKFWLKAQVHLPPHSAHVQPQVPRKWRRGQPPALSRILNRR